MSKYLSKIIIALCLTVFLVSCSNPFEYKANDWVQVSETQRDDYEAAYVDQNRISYDKEGNCLAWIKLIFAKEKEILFSGKRKDEVSGYMLAKRVDSSVKYFCKTGKAQIISYQIYNTKDEMIDSKWIESDPIVIEPNTVHYDIWRYTCLIKKR